MLGFDWRGFGFGDFEWKRMGCEIPLYKCLEDKQDHDKYLEDIYVILRIIHIFDVFSLKFMMVVLLMGKNTRTKIKLFFFKEGG